jgi:hypothetical protein
MTMKNIYSYRKRAFLNPVSTNHTSYILALVESSRGGENKFGTNLIHLADCQRVIQLEFFLGTEQDREVSLKKINLMIETFTRFVTSSRRRLP